MSFPNLMSLKIWQDKLIFLKIDYKNQQMKRNDKFHQWITLTLWAFLISILLWFRWKLVMILRRRVFRSEDDGNGSLSPSSDPSPPSGFSVGRTEAGVVFLLDSGIELIDTSSSSSCFILDSSRSSLQKQMNFIQ